MDTYEMFEKIINDAYGILSEPAEKAKKLNKAQKISRRLDELERRIDELDRLIGFLIDRLNAEPDETESW